MSAKDTTTLYTALLAAQRAMGPVKKDASNPAFRTKYATLQSVLETIEEPLWANGLIVMQRFAIADDGAGMALMTEIIHAESGERTGSVVPIVSKDPTDPQKMGGAITYYRRYSLLALLGLAPEDDDGNAAAKPAPRAQERPAPAPPAAPVVRTDDDTLLAVIKNDLRDPDLRKKALHDYYSAAGDVADLNRRVEQVKASGIPEDTLAKAYRHHHTRLAQLFVPGHAG
jgi:hypothetical protein